MFLSDRKQKSARHIIWFKSQGRCSHPRWEAQESKIGPCSQGGRGGIFSVPCQLQQHLLIMAICKHMHTEVASSKCVTLLMLHMQRFKKIKVGWLHVPWRKHMVTFVLPDQQLFYCGQELAKTKLGRKSGKKFFQNKYIGIFRTRHRFSIGFSSGQQLGHCTTLILFQ